MTKESLPLRCPPLSPRCERALRQTTRQCAAGLESIAAAVLTFDLASRARSGQGRPRSGPPRLARPTGVVLGLLRFPRPRWHEAMEASLGPAGVF